MKEKGPSLVCWFEQFMESGDASNKEAPPCDPKATIKYKKEQSKVISMLVATETKDSLRRYAIMVITKQFGLAHAEQKAHISWAKLILQNFVCMKYSLCTP